MEETSIADQEPESFEHDGFIDLLLSSGKLSRSALDRARRSAAQTQDSLVTILTKLGLLSEGNLVQLLSSYYKMPVLSRQCFPDAPVLSEHLNRQFLRHHSILPISNDEAGLLVAIADPSNNIAIRTIQLFVTDNVRCGVASLTDINDAITRLYSGKINEQVEIEQERGQRDSYEEDDVDRLTDIASDAPIIKLVHSLITEAVETESSDIHIEPFEDRVRVRFRYDGMLREMRTLPKDVSGSIASRIKIMARLNIAERRVPQDGRLRHTVRGRDIDIRVSSSPTLHGESLVLRILDRGRLTLDFLTLGFDHGLEASFRHMLNRPHGIILVTGPTGSGKTTTLYTALLSLNSPEKKILTIEDPIEYQLDGINQQAVMPQIGRSFAGALRSFLRQDPDVIMVGEIRDSETAQIAVQAALTGHLILATLHTNDASGAMPRLLDMGIDNYLLTTTIVGVLAQRLVRCLCKNCCKSYVPSEKLQNKLREETGVSIGGQPLFKAVGCSECYGTGYRGRTVISELLEMSEPIRALVIQRAGAQEVFQVAVNSGMQTMYRHGVAKALSGETSLEEVMRVMQEV